VRHEYVDVPENQRLACLKFILKKEIASWKGGLADDENKEEGENGEKNENENENVKENVKITNIEKEKNNENQESEIISTKKTFPRLKKLLSRREKNTISEISTNLPEKIELVSQANEGRKEVVEKMKVEKEEEEVKVEKETVNSSPFPLHFSPFPAAQPGLSSVTFRPFQAVIFADDEDLAVTVCDTVGQLLSQKGI
jgi:hypothetical protein